MALWLVRTGRHGEHERQFLDENRIFIDWAGNIRTDISGLSSKSDLRKLLSEALPDAPPGKISNALSQIWAFARNIELGDWVVVPSKRQPAIHVAKVTGGYAYDAKADPPLNHVHQVKWLETDIPRSKFDQDLLSSFGALMTLCQIKRRDAEGRVRAIVEGRTLVAPTKTGDDGNGEVGEEIDLQLLARDQIAKAIIAKYKGHGLANLVERDQ